MDQPNFEWIVETIAGTAESLAVKLNEMQKKGLEIFQVVTLTFPGTFGWVVIARAQLLEKAVPVKPVPEPVPVKEPEPEPEAPKHHGVVDLHKHKR